MTARLRAALVATETNTFPALAPDGELVAYVQATAAGDTVRVHTPDSDFSISAHPGRRVRDVSWTGSGRHVLYRHAERGREVWALTILEVETGRGTTLDASSMDGFWIDGDTIAYSTRAASERTPSLWRLDADDAAPARYCTPVAGRRSWLVDRQLRPRGGLALTATGATLTVTALGGALIDLKIPADALAEFAALGFNAAGDTCFILSSADVPTRRLLALDTVTGVTKTLFADDEWDLASFPLGPPGVWCHPLTGEPDICSVFAITPRLTALTPDVARSISALRAAVDGEPVVLDRSADDSVWLVGVVHDDAPLEYVRFVRSAETVVPLFVNRPELLGLPLAGLSPVRYEASDGQQIEGYHMAAAGASGPQPTVVLVHGGPASRDLWRFHADAQFLAALGFGSLHLNYRGSSGRGRDFRLAGHGEWGARMQNDLYDGLAYAIAAGQADPDAVCFWGASYGGYAALLAATTRPDLVKAAIAISPQCDLAGLTTNPAPFWRPIADRLARQVLGEVDADTARRLVRKRSPLHQLRADCPPLLIAHGVRDPRIPVSEVDAFVARARDLGVPVTYLRFDDEGHHVQALGNRQILFREIEGFLERHVHS